MKNRSTFAIAVLFALGGCAVAPDPELPAGHPATVAAATGAAIPVTGALEPEAETVRPKIKGAPAQQPPKSAGQHESH